MSDSQFKLIPISSVEDLHNVMRELGVEGEMPEISESVTEEREQETVNEEKVRFERMVKDFEYFASKTADPFVPCGFLHKLIETALKRAYDQAYRQIGEAKDPDPFICAATHIKKCKDLYDEVTDELSAAIGDMHRGGADNVDMMSTVQKLMEALKNVKR